MLGVDRSLDGLEEDGAGGFVLGDPGVLEGLLSGHACFGVEFEAPAEEVDEEPVPGRNC